MEPHAASWSWGVDLSTRRLAIACDGPDRVFGTIEFPNVLGAPRLAAIWEKTLWLAQQLAADRPPLYVFVEAPTGRHPNPSLSHAGGVVMGAIYAALLPLTPFPTTVAWIPIATWKKLAVGNGHASKDDVADWARSQGLEADDQDVADAFAIARAGRLQLGL